jgi:hypothetical protein
MAEIERGANNITNGKHRWSSWKQEEASIGMLAEAGTCFWFYARDRCFFKNKKLASV